MNKQQQAAFFSDLLELAATGKMARNKARLLELHQLLKTNPLQCWDELDILKQGQATLLLLFSDVIENEDEEIWVAHLAYLYFTKALTLDHENQLLSFAALKNRLILLSRYDDFFAETVQYFYFKDQPTQNQEELNQRRFFALSQIKQMQRHDLLLLEQLDDRLNEDEVLLDIEQLLYSETEDLTEATIQEIRQLHDILFQYSFHQAKTTGKLF